MNFEHQAREVLAWFVYDPDVLFDGQLYGPFETQEKAEQYANLLHPDDMRSGNTVVLEAVKP